MPVSADRVVGAILRFIDGRPLRGQEARRPDQLWTGGTIPIIFHLVLAAFQ